MAGLTISEVVRSGIRNRRLVIADVTFDSSYPTGGETLAPKALGLPVIEYLGIEHSGTETIVYDRANGKLLIYTADGTQAGDTTDQHTVSCRVLAIG